MKKIGLLSVLCVACATMLHAQIVQENEMALVYYMPQTVIDVDITYTIETEEAGPYHAYAKRYLGAEDVISTNARHAEIVEVNVYSDSQADLSRPVKVVPDEDMDAQLLAIHCDGTLYGYNVNPFKRRSPQQAEHTHETAIKKSMPEVYPLLEEQLKAQSTAQAAESVAKQIYRIREAKMYLLSGEIENAPGDGAGLEVALKELNRQERQLVQLFTGKRTRKTMQTSVRYIPSKSEEKALLYFSPENGITAEEDVSALPVMIQFSARKQVLAPATGKAGKKAPVPSQIYYNLPGYGNYTISYDGAVLQEGSLPVAQFGIAVPLAKSLFTGKKQPEIHFNTETGNILSIEK